MEVVQESVTVPADRTQLAELRACLHRVCRQFGIRASTTRRLVLAIDEAASNIMEHGQLPAGSSIEISLEFGEESIVAQIRDRGVGFDPRGRRTLRDASRRLKRGFGLYLIHLITDRIDYERTTDGRNVLTLTIDGR